VTPDDGSGAGPARSPAELAGQLRAAADRLLAGWTGAPGRAPAAPPGLPVPPATLTAQQLQAVVDDIAARRAQVQTLRTQLGAFDEQLGALEASLGPLLEWTRTWAGLESTMLDLWRPDGKRTEGR
jgi:outer membrane protein TolC